LFFLGLLKKFPASGKFLLYKGLFEFTREHDFYAAIKDMDEALQIEPTLHQAMYLRGCCYLQAGKKAEAYDYFRKAASYGNAEARRLLSQVYLY
jgi:Tfp pilus assembly protein PilF